MDSLELYRKAQEIKNNINSIKEITKNILNQNGEDTKIDRKELLNLGYITKSHMKNYILILDKILNTGLDAEERENILEILDEINTNLGVLEESIIEVKKKR